MNKMEFKGQNEKGKNIIVLSGVHGNELTPIYSTYLLSKSDFSLLDFNKLTIISSINRQGIIKNSRDIPNTTTNDINRMFTTEETIDFDDFVKILEENDVIIDVHSSPWCTEFLLINQDERANSYVEFCNKLNISYAIRFSSNNTIKKFCLDKNKISFTLELNGLNYIDKNSGENGENIITKIVKNIEMFENKPSEPEFEVCSEFFTYKEGLFLPTKRCGENIEKNEILGYIINLETFEESKIIMNKSGKFKIICYGDTNYIDSNNPICLLQPLTA